MAGRTPLGDGVVAWAEDGAIVLGSDHPVVGARIRLTPAVLAQLEVFVGLERAIAAGYGRRLESTAMGCKVEAPQLHGTPCDHVSARPSDISNVVLSFDSDPPRRSVHLCVHNKVLVDAEGVLQSPACGCR